MVVPHCLAPPLHQLSYRWRVELRGSPELAVSLHHGPTLRLRLCGATSPGYRDGLHSAVAEEVETVSLAFVRLSEPPYRAEFPLLRHRGERCYPLERHLLACGCQLCFEEEAELMGAGLYFYPVEPDVFGHGRADGYST